MPAENATASGFLSEDGTKFVSIRDDSTKSDDANDIANNEDVAKIAKDFKIDLSKLPDEHRDAFVSLAKQLGEMSKKLDGLKNNEGLADAIQGLKSVVGSSKTKVDDSSTATEKKKRVDGLQFEKDDYYQKFFQPVIDAVNEMADEIAEIRADGTRSKAMSFQEKVVSFIKEQKLSKDVISKMDEIAVSMGRGVYNDLPRLAKLAKDELGLKDEKVSNKSDDEQGVANRRRKASIELVSSRRASSAKKPIKSMAEAWDKAEEDLEGEE